VLVEHRVDDVDERLVAVEEPVPAGQEVALEPALALVLGEHFHDASIGTQGFVDRQQLGVPRLRRRLEHRTEAVGGGLVRPEEPEVVRVRRDHVTKKTPEHPGRLAEGRAGLLHLDPVIPEAGQTKIAKEEAAVRVRVRSHAQLAFGRERTELSPQSAVLVEELLGPVALHPLFEQAKVIRVLARLGQRHLV
jgi:hypothetical protein